ncbi:MAG: class I SAM-dependent methyltransferase, partial [Spirochaetia bacterium]|nr:class I SAM-dependent methyltransferase [Spirochaetia bacterium]
DGAEGMISWAKKKNKHANITFICADVLSTLDLQHMQFDLAITSYVAHGMIERERKTLYALLSRLGTKYVIIHDYNDRRSVLTSFIERLEGGDYFTFIRKAREEMEKCVSEMRTCFEKVEVVQVGKRANWYICTPAKES